ncbi:MULTISPECIES: CHAP domain-containing protein [unclassified Luteococcus]|uniref:CHAP domain-containing protein n=1 Tax=unclassified Luteococcus TaxID=2639923 RepID=UPI00313DE881
MKVPSPALRRRSVLTAMALGTASAAAGCSHLPGTGPAPSPSPFPSFPAASLNAFQKRVLAVLKTEYDAQPSGTKYSQGVQEAWCADFVSWVLKQAGRPLQNPNSGGWRIPGTMTLLDTLRTAGVWHPIANDFSPRPADIVIYDRSDPFGQHTNFVLDLTDGRLTTIGGNEGARNLTISPHRLDAKLGVLGYGRLP